MSVLHVGIELPGADLLDGLKDASAGLAQRLDRSGAAFAVLGAERVHAARQTSLNPTVAATWLAQQTRSIGLVLAASVQRDHPYNLARRLASVDHVSAGRAAWLATVNDHALALGLHARSSWTSAPLDDTTLADAIAVVRKLWRTWPLDTLHADPAISSAAQVRLTDHRGVFPVRGPLNSPSTPQGEPIVLWRWQGRAPATQEWAAAAQADIVVVDAAQLETLLAAAGACTGLATPQLYVRVTPEQAAPASIARWKDHTAIHGLVLACGPGELTHTIERRLPPLLASVSAPAAAHGAHALLRMRLGIARRAHPNIAEHAPAFGNGQKEVA